jgi:hypothetical protein
MDMHTAPPESLLRLARERLDELAAQKKAMTEPIDADIRALEAYLKQFPDRTKAADPAAGLERVSQRATAC